MASKTDDAEYSDDLAMESADSTFTIDDDDDDEEEDNEEFSKAANGLENGLSSPMSDADEGQNALAEPKQVLIVSPATLPGGVTFVAEYGNRRFHVTVPPDGFHKGCRYFVPYLEDNDEYGGHADGEENPTTAAAGGANTRFGKWRYGLFECLGLGLCSPVLWLSCLCSPILLGQIMTRMLLTWCGDKPTGQRRQKLRKLIRRAIANRRRRRKNMKRKGAEPGQSTPVDVAEEPIPVDNPNSNHNPCQTVTILFIFAVICASALGFACYQARNDLKEAEALDCHAHSEEFSVDDCTDQKELARARFNSILLALRFFLSTYGLYMLCAMTKTRRSVRSFYGIPARSTFGPAEDCLFSLFCSCCTIAQMARHTGGYESNPARCCTRDGLSRRQDQGDCDYSLGMDIELV